MLRYTRLLAILSLGVTFAASCGDNSSELSCGDGTSEVDGVCTPTDTTRCGAGTVAEGDECVPDGSVICETGTMFDAESGTCVPDITGCASGTVVVDGECRDPADVVADISESAEPNDFPTPGEFDLPAAGESITISGCIEPTVVDGEDIADFDSYAFAATGPTLLEVTVDGFGGAAGAFRLITGDEELVENGFARFGINLTSDMTKRQVYLPKEATYGISFGDSRTLLSGNAAGGPGACYLATIRNVAIPDATAITAEAAVEDTISSETKFYRFTPPVDDSVSLSDTSAAGESILIDSILMVDGEYHSNSPGLGARDFGDPAENRAANLDTDSDVLYVVDPVVNLGLSPAPFTHQLTTPSVAQLPSDGSSVNVPAPGANFFQSLLAFEVANDGDVVYLDLDATALDQATSSSVTVLIRNSALDFVAVPEFRGDGASLGHFRFDNAGTYYIDISDSSGSTNPFDFVATQVHHTPTPVTIGTALEDQSLSEVSNSAFYIVDPGAFEWWDFTGESSNFTGVMAGQAYENSGTGRLGSGFISLSIVDEFQMDPETNTERTLVEQSPRLIWIFDGSGTANANASFDFLVSDVPFTDLGTVEVGTPINEMIANSEIDEHFVVTSNPGEYMDIQVTGTAPFDPTLNLVESSLLINENSDPNFTESIRLLGTGRPVPFIVNSDTDDAFAIDVVAGEMTSVSNTPNLAIPDDGSAFTPDVITAPTCTISQISLDIDITHPRTEDLIVQLRSPLGQAIQVHAFDDLGANLVGTYPTTLTPEQDILAFIGTEAEGDWTLELADAAAGATGTLNEWGLNFICE